MLWFTEEISINVLLEMGNYRDIFRLLGRSINSESVDCSFSDRWTVPTPDFW